MVRVGVGVIQLRLVVRHVQPPILRQVGVHPERGVVGPLRGWTIPLPLAQIRIGRLLRRRRQDAGVLPIAVHFLDARTRHRIDLRRRRREVGAVGRVAGGVDAEQVRLGAIGVREDALLRVVGEVGLGPDGATGDVQGRHAGKEEQLVPENGAAGTDAEVVPVVLGLHRGAIVVGVQELSPVGLVHPATEAVGATTGDVRDRHAGATEALVHVDLIGTDHHFRDVLQTRGDRGVLRAVEGLIAPAVGVADGAVHGVALRKRWQPVPRAVIAGGQLRQLRDVAAGQG